MSVRKMQWTFIVLFLAMILIPLLTTNLQKDKISKAENRRLAAFPSLVNEDGTMNSGFTTDFETWINDNIGMRSNLVVQNARIQYYIFDVLSNNSNTILGPNGEFNYATDAIIKSYQHLNLKSEEELQEMAVGFQYAKEYLENKGIQFYYYQCWDKQSIYPEYFPKSIIQHGNQSATDQIVENLNNNTDVVVISPKKLLIDGKTMYETYSKWGDATHWTQRGAYIGYCELMNVINSYNANKYKILTEDDYEITVIDQGYTLFGGIHNEDYLENFDIKNPAAYHTDEEPIWLSQWEREGRLVFYNDSVNNEDTILILGDSYFDNFIYDDIAESFHKTVLIWGDYTPEFQTIIETYDPTIVVVENAERCDRTSDFSRTMLRIKNEQ